MNGNSQQFERGIMEMTVWMKNRSTFQVDGSHGSDLVFSLRLKIDMASAERAVELRACHCHLGDHWSAWEHEPWGIWGPEDLKDRMSNFWSSESTRYIRHWLFLKFWPTRLRFKSNYRLRHLPTTVFSKVLLRIYWTYLYTCTCRVL